MDIDALLADGSDSDGDINLDDFNLEDLVADDSSGSDDDIAGTYSLSTPLPPSSAFDAVEEIAEFSFIVNEDLEALLRDAEYGGDSDDDGDLDADIRQVVSGSDSAVKDIVDEAAQVTVKDTPTTPPSAPVAPPAPAPAPASHAPAPPSTLTSFKAFAPALPPATPPLATTTAAMTMAVSSSSSSSSSAPRRTLAKSRLELAESREQRLLKSGVSETLSPLQGKRRGRAGVGDSEGGGPRAPGGDQGSSGVVISTLDAISRQLQKNAAVQYQHSPGLPTAVSVHSKFIAIGTDRSLVLLFDHFQEVRQILGSTGDAETDGPVTSIDVSSGCDLLVSGFVSGKVVLWDILKGTVLKVVPEAHASPLTVVRFYNEGTTSVVSVDTKGCVNKLSFTKTMWMSYNVTVECLLDGAAGQVPALTVLPPWSLTDAARPTKQPASSSDPVGGGGAGAAPGAPNPLLGLSIIAISSEKTSFVVGVEPAVKVIFKWPRPPGVRGDGTEPFLPCLSLGWSLVRGGGPKVMPVLARGLGPSVQLLRVSVESTTGAAPTPSFVACESFTSAAPVLAVEWLGQQVVAFLDANFVLHIVDTLSMSLLEATDVSSKLVFATYIRGTALKPAAPAPLEDGAAPVAPFRTDVQSFQNSFRACDGRLYLLGNATLQTARVQSWTQRIEALVEDGEWLEALAHSLDHYEAAIKPFAAPRALAPVGGMAGEAVAVSPAAGQVADLLLRYLNLAIENAPVHKAPSRAAKAGVRGRIDLVLSHFQMIAGVCIEFCVVVERLDLLFGTIFNRFVAANQARVLLDLLEPYVLQEKITFLGPEVMQSFVDHFQHKGDLSAVERCLLHMDVKMLDFNNIVTILRKHRLYSALIHVYTSGLDEYIPPLELMLEGAIEAVDVAVGLSERSDAAAAGPGFETVGFKALLYVHYCLKGMGFPSGVVPPERVAPLQKEIIEFVLLPSLSPSTCRRLCISEDAVAAEPSASDSAALRLSRSSFPYLRLLLRVDCPCTLQAFSLLLDQQPTRGASGGNGGNGGNGADALEVLSAPRLVRVLTAVLLPALAQGAEPGGGPGEPVHADAVWAAFADGAAADLKEFVARHMSGCRASPALTDAVLQHLAGGRAGMAGPDAHALLASILPALSPHAYDRAALLPLLEAAGFTRAALVLHKTSAAGAQRGKAHFPAAIHCFLVDPDAAFRAQVFGFIVKELEQQRLRAKADGGEAEDVLGAMKMTVMAQLAVLVDLDRLATGRLVADLFADDHKRALKALAGTPRQQFGLLSAMVTGPEEPDEGAAHFALDDSDLQLFVALMAQFDPGSVYKYLSTHSDYPLDECARICREHKITEAEAYLLERLGDISGALDLILTTIEHGLEALKRRLRGSSRAELCALGVLGPEASTANTTGKAALAKLAEGAVVKRNIGVAIEMCERNTGEADDEQQLGTQLWNHTLDRLLMTKTVLKLKGEAPHVRAVLEAVLTEVLQRAWNKMSSHVPLALIMRKITNDRSDTHLGELRDIILSVLDTSAHESSAYKTSVSLVARDLHNVVKKRQRIKGAGLCVRGLRVAATGDLVQFGDEAQDFPGDSTIAGTRAGVGEVATSAPHAVAAHLEGDAAAHEATMRRARVDRSVRRLRPKVSLSDHMARAGQPSLLSTAPRGIPRNDQPQAPRVPGTLNPEPMFVSAF